MKKMLAAALLCSALVPVAFANTNAGSRIFISSAAVTQTTDLVQADYEALSWVEVKSIGTLGETGSKTNILNYNTWDTTVTQKAKGITDAGSPTLEVARLPTDPGQVLLRSAALGNLNWGIKVVRNDPAAVGGTGTIRYNRGLVVGPTQPNGKNEDFDLEMFTFGLQQIQLTVNPGAAGNPPKNTVLPAITGTATVGQVLTVSNGTFTGDATILYTYQWFAGGVPIVGATASTYTLTIAEQTKIIQCRVAAQNLVGSAQAYSNATAAVS